MNDFEIDQMNDERDERAQQERPELVKLMAGLITMAEIEFYNEFEQIRKLQKAAERNYSRIEQLQRTAERNSRIIEMLQEAITNFKQL